ncbi:glutathione S-transferase family protein [Exilibacterium tricleocarpae]|uniref:Glutathione S-transferase family protein n=1 Tax=Exilibacterium tricleocarpae TaxID=2591008 RepID=A0A545SQM3_9GAMM|nr:glutathione S-transferase family protein [Exilibacterium tricleocarpae]
MKHYYHPMSRAVTTDWMLRELNVEHEQIVVDYMAGQNHADTFKAINPMEKVPALVDDGIVITEVAAICAYLADKFPQAGMAPPITGSERGRYYRYLFFSGNTLEPMFTLQNEKLHTPAQSVGWGDLKRVLSSIEEMTPTEDWVMGDRFGAADIVFGGTLDFSVQFGWLSQPSPKVADYVRRIKARPAYQASHEPSWHQIPDGK